MTNSGQPSKGRLWTGHVLTGLVAAFLTFDGVTKVMQITAVRPAFAQLGYAEFLAPRLGAVLLVCLVLYLIPRTCVLGAVLITAWLGGAMDCNVHALQPAGYLILPIAFGVLTWLSLYLRYPRLGLLLPFRLDEMN